jgi:hypothetical protein
MEIVLNKELYVTNWIPDCLLNVGQNFLPGGGQGSEGDRLLYEVPTILDPDPYDIKCIGPKKPMYSRSLF